MNLTGCMVATLACAGMLGLPGATHAQAQPAPSASGYYSCRDAGGRLITSDRPIIECLNREQRVHNSDGSVRRIIEAPLTAEQKRQRDEEARRRAEDQVRADERRRRDQILLSSYSSLDSLDRAQQRALTEPQSGIAKSQARLEQLRKEQAALISETEFYKGRKLPGDLERKIQDNEFARRYEADLITRRNEEIRQINERFDADKARFRALTEAPRERR